MLAGQTFPAAANSSSGLSGARVDYFVFQIAALRTAHINRSPETTTYSGWGMIKIQQKFLLTVGTGSRSSGFLTFVRCADEQELVPTVTHKKCRAAEAALHRNFMQAELQA